MSCAYTITEPHPTVPRDTYTHAGRGGLGNFFRAPETTPASGVPTPAVATRPASLSTARFYSGRGGAGNAHMAAERPVISFDEEYVARDKAAGSTAHFGRGGAGNVSVPAPATAGVPQKRKERKQSSTSTVSSLSSSGSVRSGFFGRLLSRN